MVLTKWGTHGIPRQGAGGLTSERVWLTLWDSEE